MRYKYYYIFKYENEYGTYYNSGEGNSVSEIAKMIESNNVAILEVTIQRYKSKGIKVISDRYLDERFR